MKLQWMPQDSLWAVFVKADSTIQPSQNILLGSGQVTVVAPTGFVVKNMTSYMGTWIQNARANAPMENRELDYISFGIRLSEPITGLGIFEETLILTFTTQSSVCPNSLSLIENDDIFAQNPNSLNTNPGNDLNMVDMGNQRAIYRYEGNYDLEAWNCNSSDNITTSIKDFQRERLVKVFPNPFHQQLIFELIDKNNSLNLQVQLYDSVGRLIQANLMNSPRLKITVADETAMYFYQIIDLEANKMVESGKLIKR